MSAPSQSDWFGFASTQAGRRFSLLVLGHLASVLGSRVSTFAGSVWVLESTGQVESFGVVLLCAFAPGLVVAPWLGQLVDRRSRKALLMGGDAALLVASLLAALAVNQHSYWGFCAVQVVSSVLLRLVNMTLTSAVPTLVEDHILPSANGVTQVAVGFADLVGPMLGGLLVGVVAPWVPFTVDAASFGVSLLMTAVIPLVWPALQPRPPVPFRQMLAPAIALVRPQPVLRSMLLVSASMNACIGLVDMLAAPVVLHLGDAQGLGRLMSLYALGATVAAVIASIVPMRRPALVYAVASVAFGLALVTMALWPSLVMMGAAGFAMSFAVGVAGVASTTEWQRRIPHGQLGQVVAARSLATEWTVPAAMGLSTLTVAAFSRWVAPWNLVGFGGADDPALRGPATLLLAGGVMVVVAVLSALGGLLRPPPPVAGP